MNRSAPRAGTPTCDGYALPALAPKPTRSSSSCANVSVIPPLHAIDGAVERFLRGIDFMHDQERLAPFVLEGHGGDGAVVTFLIRPDEARVRRHLKVLTEERHRLRALAADLETVSAPDTNIRLAGKQDHADRLRRPRKLQQLGPGPRLEHDAGRAVEGSRNNELTLGPSLHRCAFVGSLPLASIDLLLPFQIFDNFVQRVEACVPELAVPLDPRRLFVESAQTELAGPHSSDLLRGDEPTCSKTPTCFFSR